MIHTYFPFFFSFSFGLSSNDYFLAWILVFLYFILPAFDSELFEILIYGVEFFSNNSYNNSLRPPNYLLTYIPLIRVTHQPLELVSGKLSGLHDESRLATTHSLFFQKN